MKKSTLAALVSLSTLLTASISSGWEAATRQGVRDMPGVGQRAFFSPPSPWFAPPPGFPDYDSTNVFITNLKDRTGGVSAEARNATSINNIYSCPSSFAADSSNLADCLPAKISDLGAEWAWLKAREASDEPHDSEHYLIAQMTANLAGLSALQLLQPFWVRYPTANAYLASPINGDRLLVAQSLRPASSLPSSTQALRSVSLLDLAQLPDSSNSLADWAEGNELCPISGIEGAFSTTTELVQACHEFGMIMGSINATHFAPLNRQSWQYYHSLAMQRMAECPKLAQLTQPFYTAFDPVVCAPGTPQCDPTKHRWYQVMHGNATEMHECEREAMAYEMFAQHFMQDSWSTGHMWKRWGKANFSQFDSEFAEYSGASGIPQENRAPRRAAIALMTAAVSGEIHGAKPMIMAAVRDQSRDWASAFLNWLGSHGPFDPTGNALANTTIPGQIGSGVSSAVTWLGLADDPLNGPTYQFPSSTYPDELQTRDVEWRSGSGNPFPGAGDLFWDPITSAESDVAVVSQQSKYAEQRSRLLECAAASMLEAYNASHAPHAFGEATPEIPLDGVNPAGDACWDHWATNEAMRAAFGVTNILYEPVTQLRVANLANTVVLDHTKNSMGFVRDTDTILPHYAARRADRDAFLAQLAQRLNRDMAGLQRAFIDNARVDPKGLKSAHGLAFDDLPITMLGVPPIDTPPTPPDDANAEPPTAPTDYSDRLVMQDASDYTPAEAGSLVNAMSKLFWRGNVERTCRTSLLNNAQELLLLQEKCRAKAAGGGNPDACTACAEIAELHVPSISLGQDPYVPVGDSKCSALGVTAKGQIPGGLPAWWFDNFYRRNGQSPGEHTSYRAAALDHPAFDVALTWCTGAEMRGSASGSFYYANLDRTDVASDLGWLPARDSEVSYEKKSEMTCSGDNGTSITAEYGISRRRNGQAFIEEYNLLSTNWVFPLVTALDYSIETVPVGQCGQQIIDSRAQRFIAAAGYVPQSKASHMFGGAAGISAPRCGVQQRMYYWNRPCLTALQNWNYPIPGAFDTFFPNEGEEVDVLDYGQDGDPLNDYCLIREPRRLVETCPTGMSCNADGECNSDDHTATVDLFPPPPPPPQALP